MNRHHTKFFARALAWVLCALMLAGTALPVLTASAETGTNIAKGKRAIACHSESDSLAPAYAVDGNGKSRFAAGSGCTGNTWYILDLGDNYDLSNVRINWEAAHASEYVLELSTDGQSYTALATVKDAESGWVETSVSGTGRFLRIREVTRALSQYGFSIWELEVYGEKALSSNTDAFHYVHIDEVQYGTLALSHEGLVKAGTEVTLTVTPMEGGSLAELTCNGENVTDQVSDGQYVFTADGDAAFSAEFATPPGERYECEDALVLGPDGVTPINPTRAADPDASGGMVVGNTGGNYYIFENVVEANYVQIAYASPLTNNMSLYIRYPWEEEYHAAGFIHFSTSNSWYMSSSYIATSSAVYIPAGSDIKIRPTVACNLDCLWLTKEAAAAPADAPANTLTADALSSKAEDDLMATYAKSVPLSAGQSVTFTVPDVKTVYNVLNLSYRAEGTAKVSLKKGSTVLGEITLDETVIRTFAGIGMLTEDYAAGDSLTFTCTEGSLWLDYLAFNYAADPETVHISALPAAGDRLTVSLDGTWAIGAQIIEVWQVPASVPDEVDFINSIPVPGLWGSAAYDLGEYSASMSWYKKTVVLDEEPTGQVLLSIGSAQYGRYIYVNGQYVGRYDYNYSASVTDLTGLLHKGENEIVIMLGAWSQQHNDKDSMAHVLYDGESRDDEPGITDSVFLIFNQAPHVSAVQTNPDIDNGQVQVRVTLTNGTAADVTSDVTISVYELGVFENGVANQKEVKVGEYTQKAVQVAADGTATFTVDAVTLSGWTKDKCWTPDSPFLYRVEIRTSGDTYSTRFGMRTFDFDPVTKYARLNGEIIYLFGTNVAIERYYDDPLCGTTPWQEDWVRKLYTEFKETNWDCFRTHLGNANELWFDLADEMGLMIFDEYPQWGDTDGCTVETIMPEIYTWIDTRANHPSVIVFDAQNEATGTAITDEICRLGREYDLQGRPWDNGWRAPSGENDPIECHPYFLGGQGVSGLGGDKYSKPVLTMADIGMTAEQYPDHPFIINEHGEIWISRDGIPMSGTAGTWEALLPNSTAEEKLTYYADVMSAQVEAFRAGRAYVGVLFFCGLGSSFPDAKGVTSDILMPDVSTAESLEIRPYTQELLKNAYADLGIVIENYTERVKRGGRLRLPITLVNDTGEAITDLPVTLKIMSGDTVLYAKQVTMSVDAFSADNKGLSTETLTVIVPAYREYCTNGTTLVVTASYELDGETVYSQRKWTIWGGDLSDDEVPTYDWLNTDDPVETESDTQATDTDPVPDTTEPAVSDESDSETSAVGDIPEDTTDEAGSQGCRSALQATLPMTVLLLLVIVATVLVRKRKVLTFK